MSCWDMAAGWIGGQGRVVFHTAAAIWGILFRMGTYRDDLEAARLRIETLEAKMKASEARAQAAEAEARELAGTIAQLEGQIGELERDAPTLITRRRRRRGLPLALGALLMLTTAGAFAAARMAMQPAEPPVLVKANLEELRADVQRKPVPRALRFQPRTRDDGQFDRDHARAELAKAARRASRCEGTTPGRGRVTVTFAPSGELSSVTVAPPHAGSPAEPCLKKAFEGMRVPAFEGGAVTVSKSFFTDVFSIR